MASEFGVVRFISSFRMLLVSSKLLKVHGIRFKMGTASGSVLVGLISPRCFVFLGGLGA